MPASSKTDTDPAAWRAGYLALRPGIVPCPGFTLEKWREVYEKCLAFLDTHAEEAAALGWDTLMLFGVHPEAGIIRPDFCGALVMSGSNVTSLTASRMGFGNTAYYRDRPGRPKGAVPLWAFRA